MQPPCSAFAFWFCPSVPDTVVVDKEVAAEEVRQEDVRGNEEERPRRFWLWVSDVVLRRKGMTPDEMDGALRLV